MKLTLVFFLTATLLLSTAHRAPAPISEIDMPTPAPKQSAKPKPKHSGGSVKRKAPSATPNIEVTPKRNLFDGTWSGFLTGNDDYRTLYINAGGTVVTEKCTKWGTFNRQPACDGVSLKWTGGGFGWGCSCIFVPNSDGKTATYTASCSGLAAGSWSAVFSRTSP